MTGCELDKMIASYKELASYTNLKNEKRKEARQKLYRAIMELWDNSHAWDCPFCGSNMVDGTTTVLDAPVDENNPEVHYLFCAGCYAQFPCDVDNVELSQDWIEAYIAWYKLCLDRKRLQNYIDYWDRYFRVRRRKSLTESEVQSVCDKYYDLVGECTRAQIRASSLHGKRIKAKEDVINSLYKLFEQEKYRCPNCSGIMLCSQVDPDKNLFCMDCVNCHARGAMFEGKLEAMEEWRWSCNHWDDKPEEKEESSND